MGIFETGNDKDHPYAMTIRDQGSRQLSTDIPVEGLRTAIMFLETELSVLEHRRADLYKTLNAFRVRYNATLGMLLGEILRLRLEQFRRLRDTNPDGDRLLDEAERDYENHRKSVHEVRDEIVQTLSKQKDRELQQKFHKASKLCHPDLVEDSQKARATEIFMDLNNAYYHNNLERVSAILELLEQSRYGLTGKATGLSTVELLALHENRLKTDISRLKQEIPGIKSSSPYLSLCEIGDWDCYFSEMKEKLEQERDELVMILNSDAGGEEG